MNPEKPRFKTAYGKNPRVKTKNTLPSRTKQSFKDETDINFIMRKFEKTGMLEHRNEHQGNYGDYTNFEDYQTSMNSILAAQEAFASVPSRIRKEFDNDPATFLRFVQNPENVDKMIEMGLATRTNLKPGIEGGEAQSPSPAEGFEPSPPTSPQGEKPPASAGENS